MMSHSQYILIHLFERSITAMEALKLYGCFRLAARISDLRNKGHAIKTKMITVNNKRIAKYYMS